MTMQRARAISALVTAGITTSMVIALVIINRAALFIGWEGEAYDWFVVGATIIADILLIAIVYRLILELLIALQEQKREGIPVPVLLFGLITLYTLVMWMILAPTISRLGEVMRIAWFVDGWTEPERRLIRTGVVFAFVVLSYYWLVWRYRDSSMVEALKRWLDARAARREARRDASRDATRDRKRDAHRDLDRDSARDAREDQRREDGV